MALIAGKSWTMTAYTKHYSNYGQMHVTWTFQQYYDVVGNYSQLYLTNIQAWHNPSTTVYTTVWPTASYFSIPEAGGNLGGASLNQADVQFPLVSGEKIYHNQDGTQTISMTVGGSVSSGSLEFRAGIQSVTQTIALQTIPRAPDLNVAAGTLGMEQSVSVIRKAGNHTYTLSYTCGSAQDTLQTKSVTDSFTWTPPLTLAAQNTTGDAVSVVFKVSSYVGDSFVAEKTYTVQYAIPDTVLPTVSPGWVTAAPHNSGAVEGISCYVQGYSRALVTLDHSKIDLSTAHGGEVASLTVVCGTETLTAAPYVSALLQIAGEVQLHCTLTDTRGRTIKETLSLMVEPYGKPTMSDIQLYRSDSAGDAADTGLYIAVQADTFISPLAGENTKLLQVRYKTSVGSFGAYEAIPSGELSVVGEGSISTSNSYMAELLLTDRLGNTAVYTKVIPTEAVFFSGRAGGGAAGFGKHPETDDLLEVAWNFRGKKNVEVEGGFTVGGDTQFTGDVAAGNVSVENLTVENLSVAVIDGKALLDVFHPVNSIYISYSHTSPAELFGGTWTRIANSFLWGCGDADTIGSTGGASAVTLNVNQMPSHSHGINATNEATSGLYLARMRLGSSSTSNIGWIALSYTGGNQAHENMPPFTRVSIWRRTA